jgi:hypothetical protein
VKLRAAAVPQRTITQTDNGLEHTLGSLGGLIALVALPLLAIPFIKRRRELGKLRAQLGATIHFESQLRAAAPLPAAPAPGATAEWTAPVYQGRRLPLRTRMLAGTIAMVLVAVGAIGIVLNIAGGHGVKHVRTSTLKLPTVPIAVLNASNAPGAAGKLAGQLRHRGVKIDKVGNLSESRPPGLLILYAPGDRDQAALLARALAGRKAAILPIDPIAQATAGHAARLAVVIA